MISNIFGFSASYCDIRCLGVIECLSWNVRATVANEVIWRNLLDIRSPVLAKQQGICYRRVLKDMIQLVPMHFTPFRASEESISALDLQEYYWCMDIHYSQASVFSSFFPFQSSTQLLVNEISSSQSCREVFKKIMTGSLRGEIPDLTCYLWLFKSGSWDILASLFSSYFRWGRFEFCPMQGVFLGERFAIIAYFWFDSGDNDEKELCCSIYHHYVVNGQNTGDLTEENFIDLLSTCITHRNSISN